MPALVNSAREIAKATHVKLSQGADTSDDKSIRDRAVEKVRFLRSLGIRADELPQVTALMANRGSELPSLPGAILDVVREMADESRPMLTNMRYAPRMASIPYGLLREVATALLDVRRNHDEVALAVLSDIRASHATSLGHDAAESERPDAGDDTAHLPRGSGARIGLTRGPPLEPALQWAIEGDDPRVAKLQLSGHLTAAGDGWKFIEADSAAETDAAIGSFDASMAIEPVGRLHLERLSMVPAGMERGELLYSLPLAPKEIVNISHKEWSTHSEEFERIVQDVVEGYSESGVAEKTELSQATDSQQRHASAYSLSGSYSYAGQVDIQVSAQRSSEDTVARKASTKQSKELTQKASTRATRDHKQSFKVESAYGNEETTIRRIENPSADRPMRLDFFEMVRKWRVDLFRHDIRLTYDLVIPSPGEHLMAPVDELLEIDAKLAEPFSFPLTMSNVSEATWEDLAVEYGADLDPPPTATRRLDPGPTAIPSRGKNEAEAWVTQPIVIDVGPDHEVVGGSFFASFGRHHNTNVSFKLAGEHSTGHTNNENVLDKVDSALENLHGRSGELTILCVYREVSHGSIVIRLDLVVTDEAIRRWRVDTWRTLRGVAEDSYFSERETLAARRRRILEEADRWDSLTLRQMEREAIMRGVLTWILGPGFSFGVPSDGSDATQNWQDVLEYGEFIEFIHQAVEWENVLFFLYPYFWDPDRDLKGRKLFLDHSDSRHREFLRAGASRVVLTIRPGWETRFTNLLEAGSLGGIEDGASPYISIAEEMQNFAKTNYPGTPQSSPSGDYRELLTVEQEAAWRTIQRFMLLVDRIAERTGAPPDEDGWLDALTAEADALGSSGGVDTWGEPWSTAAVPTEDPWGNSWSYRYPGTYGLYDLASTGPDAEDGTAGDVMISSWASASLIGRWYEYTPTGALDMGIDSDMSTLA